MMLPVCHRIKALYNEEKNGNGLRLQHNCDLYFKLHRKDTPDDPVMETTVKCADTTAVVDIALIAGCAAAALIVLGILKGIIKFLFR